MPAPEPERQVQFLFNVQYPNVGRGSRLRLHGEAVYCLRRFTDLIGDMAESAWVRFVRQLPRNERNARPDWNAALEDRMAPHDSQRTSRVAGWAYAQAETAHATVWHRGRDGLVTLDPRWRSLLRA